MTFGYRDTAGKSESSGDPLFPWLMKIKNSAEDLYSGTNSGENLDNLLYDCISTCKQDARYRNDLRFLKIWFLYDGDNIRDYVRVTSTRPLSKEATETTSPHSWEQQSKH